MHAIIPSLPAYCDIYDLLSHYHLYISIIHSHLAKRLATLKKNCMDMVSLFMEFFNEYSQLVEKIGLHGARHERPNEEKQIMQRLKNAVEQLESVSTQYTKYRAEGAGLYVAFVGEEATVTVYAGDLKDPCSMSAELVSSDGCSQVRGEVKKATVGQYKVSYQPQHRERHYLHIRVGDKHISGSPFPVSVLTTTPTNIITGLKEPCGLALNKYEQLVVVERNSHCVSVFKEDKTSFGSFGSDPGQLNHPSGVAISPITGDILVCDKANNRLQIFSPGGRSKECVGTKGSGPLRFNYPVSIAIHPHSNKIFITDRDNHRVQILNDDFTFFSIIDEDSLKPFVDSFDPYDISFDNSGYVYVTNCANHRVQVFTAEGKYTRQFGEKGKGEELNQPRGIAIDSNDIVYIFEHDNYCISLFTENGHFLRSFGSKGEEPGNFVYPNRIIVSKGGVIYISDTEGHRVQVF